MAIKEYLAIGKLLSILAAVALICWQSSQIHRWHKHYDSEHAAHLADNASYRAAQKAAGEQNKAQVAKVEQQQQKVTDDVETRYRSNLARLRADNDRLRSQGTTPSGVADKPGSPTPGPASSGPGNQAVPLPSDELLHAREEELQLNALIDWVLQQAAVNPNQ
jgi:hypothetical protein